MVISDISFPSIHDLNNMHQKMNEEIMINTRHKKLQQNEQEQVNH